LVVKADYVDLGTDVEVVFEAVDCHLAGVADVEVVSVQESGC
jgi:hypothetical protein